MDTILTLIAVLAVAVIGLALALGQRRTREQARRDARDTATLNAARRCNR